MTVNDKNSSEDLPADEGHQAFRDRKTPDDNPYVVDDWRFNEWQFGWDCEEQSSPDLFDWPTGKFNYWKTDTVKSNMLIEFRDYYAGPWPRAVLHLFLVAMGGPLIAVLVTDATFSLRLFVGSSLVACFAFAVGVWAKQRYPRPADRT